VFVMATRHRPVLVDGSGIPTAISERAYRGSCAAKLAVAREGGRMSG